MNKGIAIVSAFMSSFAALTLMCSFFVVGAVLSIANDPMWYLGLFAKCAVGGLLVGLLTAGVTKRR